MRFCAVVLCGLFWLCNWQEMQAQRMSEAKWWAGFTSGINFASISLLQTHTVFENIGLNPAASPHKKLYFPLSKNVGVRLGTALEYQFTPTFSIAAQPAFESLTYHYHTAYSWKDSLSNLFTLTNLHHNNLYFLTLPIQLKYGITLKIVRFYAQGGGSYSFLVAGIKYVQSSERYNLATGKDVFLNGFEETFNVYEQTKPSQLQLTGGIGVSIDINFFRIGIEANYSHSLTQLTDANYRYSNARLVAGVYEVPDDIKLNVLSFALVCSTPLDYLIHTPGLSAKPVRRR